MVARLQRLLVAAALLAAAAWAAWWWPHDRVLAMSGLLLLAPHAPVLAVEFAWMHRANRNERLPRAGAAAVMGAWAREVGWGWRVFAGRQPFRPGAVPDDLSPREPTLRGVVLVHGFVCNRGFWTPWLRQLRAQGRAFVAVNLEPLGSDIDGHVAALSSAVAQVAGATGGQAPLVVAHSMGGLVVRAWLRADPGARAHRVATIGTPHQGTALAPLAHTHNGRQMQRGGEWLARLAADEALTLQPYARFVCWYSNCDNIVFPARTAALPGADNRFVPGQPHVGLAFDRRVVRETLALADAPALLSKK